MYKPYDMQEITTLNGHYSPSMVKPNSKSFDFWQRSLYQRLISVFDFEFPANWSPETQDFFKFCIYTFGFVGVFESQNFGLSFQPCTFKDRNFYYQPKSFIVSNPYFKGTKKYDIGKTGELLKLTSDYLGVWDIINRYAEKLSSIDSSIDMSLLNTRIPYILMGRNKAAAEALKKTMDKVHRGEPAVVVDMKLLNDKTDKDSPFQCFEPSSVASNYITTNLLSDLETILNSFDSEIGIPVVGYEKKERLTSTEAGMKKADSSARSNTWFTNLTSSIDTINTHFGSDLSVSLHYQDDVINPGK